MEKSILILALKGKLENVGTDSLFISIGARVAEQIRCLHMHVMHKTYLFCTAQQFEVLGRNFGVKSEGGPASLPFLRSRPT